MTSSVEALWSVVKLFVARQAKLTVTAPRPQARLVRVHQPAGLAGPPLPEVEVPAHQAPVLAGLGPSPGMLVLVEKAVVLRPAVVLPPMELAWVNPQTVVLQEVLVEHAVVMVEPAVMVVPAVVVAPAVLVVPAWLVVPAVSVVPATVLPKVACRRWSCRWLWWCPQ